MKKKEIIPYESIFQPNKKNFIQNADKIIREGWSSGKYPTIDISTKIDWELKNLNERSWNYNLHSLDMIDPMLKAYSNSNEEKYLKIANDILLDYVQDNIVEKEKSVFVWYDMAVGLRTYKIAYLHEANMEKDLLTEGEKKIIWNCLSKHCNYLDNEENIAFHSNHGFFQLAGQLAATRRFKNEISIYKEYYDNGQKRLNRILEIQFTDDGVHKEHSPNYHRMIYHTLKILVNENLIGKDNESLHKFVIEIENALSWFVLPDGYLANFGDSDQRYMQVKPKAAKAQWNTANMQYLTSKGKMGTLPIDGLKVYEKGGYYIVRKSLEEEATPPKYSYLAQIAAFHSRTHKHADDLSFIWYDFNEQILVDAGRYGYIGKTEINSPLWKNGFWYSDINRMYCESTSAHNTLEFNGELYPRKGVPAYGSAIKRHIVDDIENVFVLETECKHFKSIRRARVLFYKPGKWLIVFDWFHDNLSNEHDVKQWFHLSPNLSLSEAAGTYTTELINSDKPLKIKSILGNISNSSTILGQIQPTMQGWYSPSEKEIIPNYAFYFQQKNTSGNFASIFSFTNQLKVDNEWSKVNASGRKGQLKWKDDDGTHKILFTRPAEGDLTFEYDKK